MALSHPSMHWNEFASLRGSRRRSVLVDSMCFSILGYAQALICSRLLHSVRKLLSVSHHVLSAIHDSLASEPYKYIFTSHSTLVFNNLIVVGHFCVGVSYSRECCRASLAHIFASLHRG